MFFFPMSRKFWERIDAARAAFALKPGTPEHDFVWSTMKEAVKGDGIKSCPADHGSLAGTTSHPDYEHWTCGTAHIRAQRVLRIIERGAQYGLTSDLIDRLENLVDEAGPADCRHALAEDPNLVPF